MNPITLWNKWWAAHGTKIIGFGATVAGIVTYIDHETVNLIGSFFGPNWGPKVIHGILVLSGLITAHRGFVNTQNANTPKPP